MAVVPMRSPKPLERRRSVGRARNPEAHQAILDATIHILAEDGFAELTIEGVARRAGVGKATIYRWWKNRAELVGEALASHLDVRPVPDLGDTRAELIVMLESTLHNFTGSWAGKVISAVAADVATDPEALASFRAWFLTPRRRNSREVMQRGIARGDLPADIDIPLMCDIWGGAIFYRALISGEDVTQPDLLERLVDLVLSRQPQPSKPKAKKAPVAPSRARRRSTVHSSS